MSRSSLDDDALVGSLPSAAPAVGAAVMIPGDGAQAEVQPPVVVNTDSQPAGSTAVYNSLWLECGYRFIDFLRFSLIVMALMGEWLHELFAQLDRYGYAPSKDAQKTWLSYPIVGFAVSSSILALILNYRYEQKEENKGKYLAAENYIRDIFSTTIVYFALDLIFKTLGDNSIPLFWYILTTAVSVPMTAALFLKYTSTRSSKEFIFPWSEDYTPTRFLEASVGERRLNAFKSAKNAFFCANTVMWVVNRELFGETVPLQRWQIGAMLLFTSVGARIGYDSVVHPKFFHGYISFLSFLKMSALIYAGISGLLSMVIAYNCGTNRSCLTPSVSELFSYVCAVLSLALGLYTALLTKIRFEKEHATNLKILNLPANAHEKAVEIAEGCGSAVERAKGAVSSCAGSVSNSLSGCTSSVSNAFSGCRASFWNCVSAMQARFTTTQTTHVQSETDPLIANFSNNVA